MQGLQTHETDDSRGPDCFLPDAPLDIQAPTLTCCALQDCFHILNNLAAISPNVFRRKMMDPKWFDPVHFGKCKAIQMNNMNYAPEWLADKNPSWTAELFYQYLK